MTGAMPCRTVLRRDQARNRLVYHIPIRYQIVRMAIEKAYVYKKNLEG